VTVRVTPSQVQRHRYDPARPPLGVKLAADELGVCITRFGCGVEFRAGWDRIGDRFSAATISAVEIETRVTIDIWTLAGAAATVAAHEEAHRTISEHFYATAGTVARRLGRRVVGRRLPMPRNAAAAGPDLRPLETEVIAGFLRETSKRCEYAQTRFDAITDHGRRSIDNRRAIAQAIAEENHHWAPAAGLPRE